MNSINPVDRARAIHDRVTRNNIQMAWMIRQLASRGLTVSPSQYSHILAGRKVRGEKTTAVIEASEDILRQFEKRYGL